MISISSSGKTWSIPNAKHFPTALKLQPNGVFYRFAWFVLKKDNPVSTSPTSLASSSKGLAPLFQLPQLFNLTLVSLTLRRDPSPTTSLFNRLPASQDGPAGIDKPVNDSKTIPLSLRSSTPIPPVSNIVTHKTTTFKTSTPATDVSRLKQSKANSPDPQQSYPEKQAFALIARGSIKSTSVTNSSLWRSRTGKI